MLRKLSRQFLPPLVARKVRRWGGAVRFRQRLLKAKQGYHGYSDRYPNPLLFVAGLPKSGTSWLESMLASYPGYQNLVIPEAVQYELQRGGSHDFELPFGTVDRFEKALAVLKLHVHGSAHNVQLLHQAEVPYVVLYRDLRDVAVSHYFYVRQTPWHPEYEDYADRSVEEGIRHFGRTLLPDFVAWIQSWRKRRDPDLSLELRYEDLLVDTVGEFRDVAFHFGLDSSFSAVERIVAEHSFENMSNGRSRGEQDETSFVRKGVAGDWQHHFTDDLRTLFKETVGDILIDLGYESDRAW